MPIQDVVSLRLQSAFEGAEAYSRASQALRGLAEDTAESEAQLKALDATAKQVQGLATLEDRLAGNQQAMAQARKEVEYLREGMAKAGTQGAALFATDLAKAQATVQRLAKEQQRLTGKVGEGRTALESAGVEVNDLAAAQTRLATQTTAAKAALEKQVAALRASAAEQAKLADIQDQLSRRLADLGNITRLADAATSVGRALGQTGFGLQEVTRKAVAFESAMADVRKVVDTTPERFAALTEEIRGLTRELPLTAAELAQIAAAGGQLGVAADQLDDFTRLAAKMGVAFDMGAGQAGDALAKLSNVFSIPILQVESLGDAINTLGNTTAARERDIVDVLVRIGGTAKQFGLTAEQASAMATALLALGRPAEVAATGINALLSKLQTATVQGKSFQDGMARLGLQSETLARQIGTAPQQALSNFLGKLRELDALSRAEILTLLFGQEYQDDLALLVGSLGQYEEALGKVADGTRTAGALNAEFGERAKTTENQLQLLRNALDDVAIKLGTAFLPPLQSAARGVADFTDAFPGLSQALAGTVLALGTLGLAAGTVTKGYAALAGAAAEIKAAFAAYQVGAVAAATATGGLGSGVAAAAAALPTLTLALQAAAAGAALIAGYKLGETIGGWVFGIDEASAAAARLAETQGRVAAKLAEVSQQTGLQLKDVAAFDAAVQSGTLYLSDWTGQWTRVPPEVVKLREELARLKSGISEVNAEGLKTPDYLREAFAGLSAAIGPAFQVSRQEAAAALELLKVDVGEAATGIRTEFSGLTDAFVTLASRSDVSIQAVGLAARTLAKEAKTTKEAEAALIALGDAYNAGRLKAEAFVPAGEALNKIIEGQGKAAAAAQGGLWSFAGTLDQLQKRAGEAQRQWELWAVANSIEQLYRAGKLSALEYLAEQDKVMARMDALQAAGSAAGKALASSLREATAEAEGLNSALTQTEQTARRVRSVGVNYESLYQQYGDDVSRYERSAFGSNIRSENPEMVANAVKAYQSYIDQRQRSTPSLSDLAASAA